MGSLKSRPKAPSMPTPQRIIYQTIPQPSKPTKATPSIASKNIAENLVSEEPKTVSPQNSDDTRKENLLSRNRGRLGTIRTGFRGLLSVAKDQGQRKSLLGE